MGAFSAAELEGRDGLPALWFRLENAPDPGQVLAVADAVLAWLARHPGYAVARAVFAECLRAVMAPLGPDIRLPDDLLEVRNMLATRAEQWKQEWLLEGRQEGEATLLLRLLERRFGALPDAIIARVRAADIVALEAWGMRILEAGSVEDVIRTRPLDDTP